MINYIYNPFNAWAIFAQKYSSTKQGFRSFWDIKQQLIIDRYILTMKKCENILNDKDDVQRLHSIMFADSLILVGDIIYDIYVESIKDRSKRNKCINYMIKETNRIKKFIKQIYTNYQTLSEEEVKMIIKEYK